MTHFYTKTESGVETRHFVENKSKGGTRPSRVTDAKKAREKGELWLPSVTTILNVLDKAALVNWKVDKHLEQAYDTQADDLDAYKRKVKAKTQEAMDSAPKAGTAIHKVLEDYLYSFFGDRPQLTDVEHKIIDNCESLISEHTKPEDSDLIKEQYFVCENHGYAGCADLVIKGAENWIIDYKSKQDNSAYKKAKPYPEHIRQGAAYGEAIFNGERFRAANIFICLETGDCKFMEHDKEAIIDGWLDFQACLSIFKRNNYNPFEGKYDK